MKTHVLIVCALGAAGAAGAAPVRTVSLETVAAAPKPIQALMVQAAQAGAAGASARVVLGLVCDGAALDAHKAKVIAAVGVNGYAGMRAAAAQMTPELRVRVAAAAAKLPAEGWGGVFDGTAGGAAVAAAVPGQSGNGSGHGNGHGRTGLAAGKGASTIAVAAAAVPAADGELGALQTPGALRKRMRRWRAYAQGMAFQFRWTVGLPVRGVWRPYRDAFAAAGAEGRPAAVRNPAAFFRALRLLGTTGTVSSSDGVAAADGVVASEARALFADGLAHDSAARAAFDGFLARAAEFNPGKRRTKFRSTVVYHMKEGSLLPKEALASYFDGLLRDEAGLKAAQDGRAAVLAALEEDTAAVVRAANAKAKPGRRVLGVLVFGSMATGAVRPGSDVDLQWVTEDGRAPEGADLIAELEKLWSKRPGMPKLEQIDFTHVPPDAGLLEKLHPEPILIVSPYADVERALTRGVPAAQRPAAGRVTAFGRAVRGVISAWLRVMLGAVDLLDRSAKPKPSPYEAGYPAGYEDLAPDAAHTIKNAAKYALDNLGAEAVAAKDDPSTAYYVVEGDGREARALLESEGWKLGAELSKAVGFHGLFRATTPAGRKAVVVLRANGADRLTHLTTFLKLAGVPAERVFTRRGTRSWKKEYLAAFRKLGYVPDQVVYGLPVSSILAVLARDPSVSREDPEVKAFKAALEPRPDGAEKNDIALRPMKVLELSDGRRIWFFMHLYGDMAGDLLDAVLEHGARKVTILGAAGALGGGWKVGDWYTPEDLEAGGKRTSLSFLKALPGVPRRGVHLHVATANGGTQAWREKAAAAGVEFVDSELKHLLDAAARHPDAALSVAHVVTEVMSGPDHTDLTETEIEDLPRRKEAVDRLMGAALDLPPDGEVRVTSMKNVPFDDE